MRWRVRLERKRESEVEREKKLGIITYNPPVVWAKITLSTRDLKSVT